MPNIVPVADAGGSYDLIGGQTLYLNAGNSSDPDEGPSTLTYKWDLDNDARFDDAKGSTPKLRWITLVKQLGYETGETYDIAVSVFDGEDSTVATSQVTVAPNTAPIADAGGPYDLTGGQILYLDATHSYDSDTGPFPLTYKWDLDNDGKFDDARGSTPRIHWNKLVRKLGYEAGKIYDLSLIHI